MSVTVHTNGLLKEAVVVGFPLRGEWRAYISPGDRIPSHGTDLLGQRYAFDFVRYDWGHRRFTRSCSLRSILWYEDSNAFLSWAAPVFAPFDGEVVAVRETIADIKRINVLSGIVRGAFTKAPDKLSSEYYSGNHIVIAGNAGYAFLAHLRMHSIQARVGEEVREGQRIAEIGNSGNSTFPHLHFQLMDKPNTMDARGVPCCFRLYEVWQDGNWMQVFDGVPKRGDRIRLMEFPQFSTTA